MNKLDKDLENRLSCIETNINHLANEMYERLSHRIEYLTSSIGGLVSRINDLEGFILEFLPDMLASASLYKDNDLPVLAERSAFGHKDRKNLGDEIAIRQYDFWGKKPGRTILGNRFSDNQYRYQRKKEELKGENDE